MNINRLEAFFYESNASDWRQKKVIAFMYVYLITIQAFGAHKPSDPGNFDSKVPLTSGTDTLFYEDVRISGVKLGELKEGDIMFGREPDSTEYRKEDVEQSYLVYFYGKSEIYFEKSVFGGFWIRDSSLSFSNFPSIRVGKNFKVIFNQLRRFKNVDIITNKKETTIYLYLHSRELASFLDCALFFNFEDDALVSFGLQMFDV